MSSRRAGCYHKRQHRQHDCCQPHCDSLKMMAEEAQTATVNSNRVCYTDAGTQKPLFYPLPFA